MFAVAGVIGLLLCVFVRPQEVHPVLARIPLFYIFFLLALAGWAIDMRLRWNRLRWMPLLPWAALFWGWSFLSVVVMARWIAGSVAFSMGILFLVYLAVSFSVETLRGFQVMAAMVLTFSAVVIFVGIHQGLSPKLCVRIDVDDLIAEDRVCQDELECQEFYRSRHYLCEHAGLLGTTSIGGRVRYRGIVQDPNELALVTSIGLPLALALVELRTTLTRALLALAYLGAGATCIIFTKSRSGLIAFLTVLAVYGVRRFKLAGAVAAGLLAVPLLMLGGRAGAEAEESSTLRLGYWAAAIQMARDNPLFGVGFDQFTEHQPQTAHSSFMLALGESGFPGLFFFTGALYVAFKIMFSILRREKAPEAQAARAWATALIASLSGFLSSAFFLSLSDSYILWMYLALAGALYATVRYHDPDFRVRVGPADLVAIFALNVVLVASLFVYTRMQGF
jgi:hypothetical protein